ncbi:HPr family phosphocarrier protein [[Clostridium] spiroforme]|nr:HPr family phosphocarrier protein [Thomasclavelia spiroformis]MBM6880366.1 HPr family phosphocarrier protein [Thomasclavelia spiroformis]MBM6931347.1 HPr family phosphocarrier protein [Thomasclavelia spiroformis]
MAKKIEVCITDPVGLYAKPVTKLVELMKIFDCYVHLLYGDKDINMKSMMGLLSLGIPCKARVTIIAEGKDEEYAIASLKDKIYDLHLGHVI